jgi:hypothetical protein
LIPSSLKIVASRAWARSWLPTVGMATLNWVKLDGRSGLAR